MALKGSRYEGITDISFFMDKVAERGGVVCLKTAGSGAALDQASAEVEYAANPSGMMPVGVLLCDMVDKDLTKTHLNFHKDEVQKGGKVVLLLDGWVTTDVIDTGVSVAGGELAYVQASGELTNTAGAGGNVEVGRWFSSEDEDGYAKLYVKLPK